MPIGYLAVDDRRNGPLTYTLHVDAMSRNLSVSKRMG